MNSSQKIPFPETHWSMLLNLKTQDRKKCVEELATKYWRPIYRVARLAGCSREQSADFTQELFLELWENPQILEKVDPDKGRFRTYLIKILRNIRRDDYKSEHRQKRHPEQGIVSLNICQEEGENWEVADTQNAASLFDEKWQQIFNEAWLETLKNISLNKVRQALDNDKHRDLKLEILKKSLFERKTNAVIMKELDLNKDFVSKKLQQIREIYMFYLQQTIMDTVSSEEFLALEVAELQALM